MPKMTKRCYCSRAHHAAAAAALKAGKPMHEVEELRKHAYRDAAIKWQALQEEGEDIS